jgi:hypothetical protein
MEAGASARSAVRVRAVDLGKRHAGIDGPVVDEAGSSNARGSPGRQDLMVGYPLRVRRSTRDCAAVAAAAAAPAAAYENADIPHLRTPSAAAAAAAAAAIPTPPPPLLRSHGVIPLIKICSRSSPRLLTVLLTR